MPSRLRLSMVDLRSFRGVELVIAVAAFAALLHAATARADCSAPGGVHINEVRYFDQNLPDDGYLTPLVEIFNKNASPVSLANYVITAADGSVKATLPAWTIPASGFLLVRFATGGADSDFSDQVGTFYTGGDSVAVFDHDADGVALYDSLGGSLVDFMAWSSTGSAPSGLAYAQAVTDSLWPSAGYIPVNPGE